MRACVALIALVAVVSAKPGAQSDTLAEEVDSFLMGLAKRGSGDPKLCGPNQDTPCCEVKTCPRGACEDDQGPGSDNLAHYYGWVCQGAECGRRAGKYVGINCDVPYETACDFCDSVDGFDSSSDICSTTSSNMEGVFCYDTPSYALLNPRSIDLAFGMGTSDQITAIAKRHAEKRELSSLVERLLDELE